MAIRKTTVRTRNIQPKKDAITDKETDLLSTRQFGPRVRKCLFDAGWVKPLITG